MNVNVSIIVPIYNVELYLNRCLDSIFEQTYTNIQVIAVNDGSTDSSLKILEKYQDSRLTIVNKENGGLSSARNEGLKYATGDYITYVDSDDWLDVVMIERMVSAAKLYNADIVSVGEFSTEGNSVPSHSNENVAVYYSDECLSQLLSMRIKTYSWGKLYKRDIFKHQECIFPEGLNYEDVATSYKFFSYCRTLVNITTPLYFYYQRSNSIVKTKRIVEVESMIKHVTEMMSYPIQNQYWGYYKLKILYGIVRYMQKLPKELKDTERYFQLIETIKEIRSRILLEKPLVNYLFEKDFYKVFLIRTNLVLLCL